MRFMSQTFLWSANADFMSLTAMKFISMILFAYPKTKKPLHNFSSAFKA